MGILVNVALVVNSIFHLWENEQAIAEFDKFMAASIVKKALYIECTLQLTLYFFLVVTEVDWMAISLAFAFMYLSSGQKSFLYLYGLFVVVSIFFDVIYALALPSFDNMSDGDAAGAASARRAISNSAHSAKPVSQHMCSGAMPSSCW